MHPRAPYYLENVPNLGGVCLFAGEDASSFPLRALLESWHGSYAVFLTLGFAMEIEFWQCVKERSLVASPPTCPISQYCMIFMLLE